MRLVELGPQLWNEVEPGVLRMLRRLCSDPATGRIPGAGMNRWTSTFDDFQDWLPENDDLTAPPWAAERD